MSNSDELSSLFRQLRKISKSTSDIKSEIEDQQEKLNSIEGDTEILEQAIEMNFWVTFKVIQEGILEDDFDLDQIRSYQQQYLAYTAISNFLRYLSNISTENQDKKEDE